VPVAVERDADVGVAHVRRERLGVDPAAIIREAKVCRASWSTMVLTTAVLVGVAALR
jgi:hypothetical protein